MDTARGPLMPRLTTVMPDTAPLDTAMDTARGLLMPWLTTVPDMASPATDTDTARGPLMLTTVPDTASPDTDTARGLLMLTTAMLDTDSPDTPTASKRLQPKITAKRKDTSGIIQNYTLKPKVPRTDMIREFC